MIALPPTHRHLVLTEMHRELEKYRTQIEQLVRPAWLLNAEAAATVARTQTHFLGDSPYMPASMGWPACDNCSNPLTFMWQVNFAEFSGSEMFEERGLFQFFYCWTCFPLPMSPKELDGLPDPMAYGYLATGYDRSSGVHYRWYRELDAHSPLAEEQTSCPSEEYVWGPPLGIRPVPILSLPHSWGDEDPIGDMLVGLDEEEKYDVLVTVDTYGDCISQLGGYPVWVQTGETPVCPVCGRCAAFVGALGSSDTGVIWGDTGYWYIFACKATQECDGLARPLSFSQST